MRWTGGASVVVLYLTWAALHDITRDNADTFPLEYSLLVVSAIWFTSVALRLLGRGHRAEGAITLLAVAIGVVACWSLPHHQVLPSMLNQLVWISLAWFFVLTLRLLLFPPRTAAPGRPLALGGTGR